MDTAFLDMIGFMRLFIDLREQDGGFMPMCGCGQEMGPHGGILLRDGEWLVRCRDCLQAEPPDDRQTYTSAEVVALSLNKYGRRARCEPDEDGVTITWELSGMSIFKDSCGGWWVEGKNVCHCPECFQKRAEREAED